MTDFIREGHFARHIHRMRMLYGGRRLALVEAIRSHMGNKLEVIGAEAGMHLVALLQPRKDDAAIAQKAAEMRMSIMPLSSCYLGGAARYGLILGYGGTDGQQIQQGIRKLAILV
jgi:GntR family transcriptional regulator/MocR family aminotransferase